MGRYLNLIIYESGWRKGKKSWGKHFLHTEIFSHSAKTIGKSGSGDWRHSRLEVTTQCTLPASYKSTRALHLVLSSNESSVRTPIAPLSRQQDNSSFVFFVKDFMKDCQDGPLLSERFNFQTTLHFFENFTLTCVFLMMIAGNDSHGLGQNGHQIAAGKIRSGLLHLHQW